MKTLNLL